MLLDSPPPVPVIVTVNEPVSVEVVIVTELVAVGELGLIVTELWLRGSALNRLLLPENVSKGGYNTDFPVFRGGLGKRYGG